MASDNSGKIPADTGVAFSNRDKAPADNFSSKAVDNGKNKKPVIISVTAVICAVFCLAAGVVFLTGRGEEFSGNNIIKHSTTVPISNHEKTGNDSFSEAETITALNWIGKEKKDAVDFLDSAGIDYDIKFSASSVEEKDKIINQSIKEGEVIPGDSVLTLFVGSGNEPSSATTVSDTDKTTSVIPILYVTVSPSKLTMFSGDSALLSVTYSPSDATETDFHFVSDDYNIAYIDSNNYIHAINPGTTYIRAKNAAGKDLGHCSVTIKSKETASQKETVSATEKAVLNITFDANGGSVSTSGKKITMGESIGTLPTATRDGYIFDGWYTHPSGGAKITEHTTASSNQTFYAHWTIVSYELRFDANGGSSPPPPQSGSTNYTISSTKPTRSGYTFLGWSKSRSATDASYYAGDYILISSDTTLYAVWKGIPSITLSSYSGNGEFCFDADHSYIYGPITYYQTNIYNYGEHTPTYGTKIALPAFNAKNVDGLTQGWEVVSGNVVINGDYMYIKQPGTIKVRYRAGDYYSDCYTYTLTLYKYLSKGHYLRSAGNPNASQIGSIPSGQTIRILETSSWGVMGTSGESGIYAKVSYGGKTGWISLVKW